MGAGMWVPDGWKPGDLTLMGRRINQFLVTNNVQNVARFAEGTVGISKQVFNAWLRKPMDPTKVAAGPILLLAEALGTNAEYLMGIVDDPRPPNDLSMEESTLVVPSGTSPPRTRQSFCASLRTGLNSPETRLAQPLQSR